MNERQSYQTTGPTSLSRNPKADESGARPRDPGDRAQLAAYIGALTSDLAAMARRGKLDTLGYLLEMARLEAEDTSQKSVKA